MDGLALLQIAEIAGLNVTADGDRLVIHGPRRAGAVARQLLGNKPSVMAALRRGCSIPRGPDAVSSILAELRNVGVAAAVRKGQLSITPKNVLTPAVRASVRWHERALVAALQANPRLGEPTVRKAGKAARLTVDEVLRRPWVAARWAGDSTALVDTSIDGIGFVLALNLKVLRLTRKELTATLDRWPPRTEDPDWAEQMVRRVDEYINAGQLARKKRSKQGVTK